MAAARTTVIREPHRSGDAPGIPPCVPSRAERIGSLERAAGPLVLALVLLVLHTGCTLFRTDRDWKPTEPLTEELCFSSYPTPRSQESPAEPASPGEAFGLSGRPAVVARALGLLPLLARRHELLRDGEPLSSGNAWRLLRIERRIASRLQLATLQLTDLSARVACEGSRARELADGLGRNKSRREDRRTVASILAGAATNVLTGIFSVVDMAVTGGALGIAGGLTQYGFRGAVEEVDVSVDFQHRRNFLHDFWEAPEETDLFPPAVWRFLTYDADEDVSLRERTIAQWKLGRNITDDQSEEFKQRYGVLFDTGGTYNLAQLRARAAMLELLRSSIDLMHADLAVLVDQLEGDSSPFDG